MLFIRFAEHTEEFYKNPPENFPALLEADQKWMEEQKKAGKLLGMWLLAGNDEGDRNVSLWEFESTDEIDKMIWECPVGFTFKWKIYPAIDIMQHIDNVKNNWPEP